MHLVAAANSQWPATIESHRRRLSLGNPKFCLASFQGVVAPSVSPHCWGEPSEEISLSGRQVDAEEALRIGLADEVVEHEALRERSLELASSLAKALVAQGLTKEAIAGASHSLSMMVSQLSAGVYRSVPSEDSQIGVKSFLEHGPGQADFVGR